MMKKMDGLKSQNSQNVAKEKSWRIRAVFLYAPYRPDNLNGHTSVNKEIIGMNAQKAILRGAMLYNTGTNPDLA